MSDKQVPLMQQPGYVYRARKRIVARNLRPGDRIQPGPKRGDGDKFTVTAVDVREDQNAVWVQYADFFSGRWSLLAEPGERIYIDRAEP